MLSPTITLLSALYILIICHGDAIASINDKRCACGYYDAVADSVFTESIIAYFNETPSMPIFGFTSESYRHPYEKGWNTEYREGADIANVGVSLSSEENNASRSLELQVSPAQRDHLVFGSSIRSLRRDIQYGSFTSFLRSPAQWAGGGGSALSMALHYNMSQEIAMNLQNADNPMDASTDMLINRESSSLKTKIQYANMTNGVLGNRTISPWNYTEYRIDWTKTTVKFRIGGHLARSILNPTGEGLLGVPSALFLRHWSNGDVYSSQGPPLRATTANAGWIRGFFNSSLMTEGAHTAFDERCHVRDACRSDDMTLRDFSTWSEEANLEWKQKAYPRSRHPIAIWLAVACIAMSASLLIPPSLKRAREINFSTKKSIEPSTNLTSTAPSIEMTAFRHSTETLNDGTLASEDQDSTNRISETIPEDAESASKNAKPWKRNSYCITKSDHCVDKSRRWTAFPDILSSSNCSSYGGFENGFLRGQRFREGPQASRRATVILPYDGMTVTNPSDYLGRRPPWMVSFSRISVTNPLSRRGSRYTRLDSGDEEPVPLASYDDVSETHFTNSRNNTLSMASTIIPVSNTVSSFPETDRRTEHLAGLVTISCLSVTVIHFCLTFVFGDLNPGTFTRSHSNMMTRKTTNQFLLNVVLIGPFLMTSTRFLVLDYLQTGDLLHVARKTVGRMFRLMVPITMMILMEYFLIDCGATKWLEYLPSVTWSSWPFTIGYTNFANFLSEILELAFHIPNAVPIVIFNYCTDVLWTVPVQLQGSWLSLLAIVVIREIKTPWKRFGFYSFCILNHWYALSWGSYCYLGIMLTDLDVTYRWRTYLHVRPALYFLVLAFFVLLAIAGVAIDIITQWTGATYALYGYGIHPDHTTGLTISQANRILQPQYFIPRFNGILFTMGIQATVELSPFIQKLLSCKLLLAIFPHIFTLYLIHGFVFWSLGSWLCIKLSVLGLKYWLNILIVAICCYSTLALCVPLLTPALEWLGKTLVADIWEFAHEEPAARKPTLHPFPGTLFLGCERTPQENNHALDSDIDHKKEP